MKPKKKTSDLKLKNSKVSVSPPKGYHWMESEGMYYLMEGDYVPHDKAVKEAKFDLVSH